MSRTIKTIEREYSANPITKMIMDNAVDIANETGVSVLAAVQNAINSFNVYAAELQAAAPTPVKKVTRRRRASAEETAEAPKRRGRRKKVATKTADNGTGSILRESLPVIDDADVAASTVQ